MASWRKISVDSTVNSSIQRPANTTTRTTTTTTTKTAINCPKLPQQHKFVMQSPSIHDIIKTCKNTHRPPEKAATEPHLLLRSPSVVKNGRTLRCAEVKTCFSWDPRGAFDVSWPWGFVTRLGEPTKSWRNIFVLQSGPRKNPPTPRVLNKKKKIGHFFNRLLKLYDFFAFQKPSAERCSLRRRAGGPRGRSAHRDAGHHRGGPEATARAQQAQWGKGLEWGKSS